MATSWNYRVLRLAQWNNDELERELIRWGAAGWDAVGMTASGDTYGALTVILKKPVERSELAPDPDPAQDNPGAYYA